MLIAMRQTNKQNYFKEKEQALCTEEDLQEASKGQKR